MWLRPAQFGGLYLICWSSEIRLSNIFDALPPTEEVVNDVSNLDPEDPSFIVDHPELDNNSQQEFGTGYHGDELNMAEVVSDPVDIETTIKVDAATDVRIEVTIAWSLN
ncbi:hypothetical protein J1N35_010491 [Gossypium stocksii]|uniref:Uncharacterized protein n=1 Tax=Gossypium stocksii TaxID=47602 RepID=A0A9D4ACC8_9ROSI|nr:hypothetical protein J1N35_010491 [Gossypium stocksii]